jgi:ankyrin repeat protein
LAISRVDRSVSYEIQSELFSILLEKDADPNIADSEGQTPLMKAAYFGRQRMVAMLLKHGSSPSFQDRHGSTALHYAADAPIVESLIRAGANPHIRNGANETPAEMASRIGNNRAASALKEGKLSTP